MDAIEDSPIPPSVVAILAGGSAVAWMLWLNGLGMFSHWFFYPSFLFLGLTVMSLLVGIRSRFSQITWTFCMWWSGLWSIVFILAVAIPPFSMFIIGSLVLPILKVGSIHPFLAGFLHVLIWACAKEVLKLTKTNKPNKIR